MTTTGSSTHVTDADIERFWRKILPGSARWCRSATTWTACADCRRRLSRRRDLEAALASLERGLDGEATARVGIRRACIRGRPARSPASARNLDTPRSLCELCRRGAGPPGLGRRGRGLQASAAAPAATENSTGLVVRRACGGRVARAGCSSCPVYSARGTTQTGDALRDADGAVSVDTDRALAATHGLSPDDVERVRRILSTGQLSFPSYMPDLVGRRGVLLGDAAGSRV